MVVTSIAPSEFREDTQQYVSAVLGPQVQVSTQPDYSNPSYQTYRSYGSDGSYGAAPGGGYKPCWGMILMIIALIVIIAGAFMFCKREKFTPYQEY